MKTILLQLVTLATLATLATPALANPVRFDAAVENNKGKVYLFSGSQYVRWDIAGDCADPGYPKPIAGNWKGIPWSSNLDAAFSMGNQVYLFKGKQFLVYDIAEDRMLMGPTNITESFVDLPFQVVEAAYNSKGKLYLFGAGLVARFDLAAGEGDDGFPLKVGAVYTNLQLTSVDAAFNAVNGKGYLFGGERYVRFALSNNRVDDGYPKVNDGNWTRRCTIQIIDATGGGV